jgi:nucleotide-binding universal stress UspA family protein
MLTLRSVLVPLDGSQFSEQAIPLAAEIARRSGAVLRIARVHQTPAAWASAMEFPQIEAEVDQELRARELAYLASITGRMTQNERVRTRSTLLDGPVADALDAHAHTVDVDLVVMSTHGRNALGRFWLGSVADQMTRRSRVPVLLVRPGEDGKAPLPRLGRFLVALDGTSFSEASLEWAVALGGLFGAEYELLTVVPGSEGLLDTEMVDGMPALLELEREEQEAAERYIRGVENRLREAGHKVASRVISGPAVHVAIGSQAKYLGVDAIAMATHGASGFERWLVGSVTDRVVRESGRPVLVVRPDRIPAAGRNHIAASALASQ